MGLPPEERASDAYPGGIPPVSLLSNCTTPVLSAWIIPVGGQSAMEASGRQAEPGAPGRGRWLESDWCRKTKATWVITLCSRGDGVDTSPPPSATSAACRLETMSDAWLATTSKAHAMDSSNATCSKSSEWHTKASTEGWGGSGPPRIWDRQPTKH